MGKIQTVNGLPNSNQTLPDFFKPIGCRVGSPFYKSCFMQDYCMYCAMHGHHALLSTDGIETFLVKDKNGTPLMYAYIIVAGGSVYTLMEIGEMQVYEVSKNKILVEKVEYHRLPFADTEKGLAIMVRNDEHEHYVHELWLRDAETGKETRLDFSGGTLEEGYEFLQKEGLVK